jgi:formylglycine-generating enzyme required for sulfatase activity
MEEDVLVKVPHDLPKSLAALGFTEHAAMPSNGEPVTSILPPLCEVPGGSFLMGNDPTFDSEATSDELPQHWVHLATFQMAKYPVTVAEYAAFVRSGHPAPRTTGIAWDVAWEHQQRAKYLDCPVVCVSWHEANEYTSWLAELTNQPWHLPSEAE